MPGDAAKHYRVHVQIATDGGGVDFAALVPKDRIPRHDSEPCQLRQVSDESLRDSIREVFKIWIVSDINEWQDRQGSDGRLYRFLWHFFHASAEPIAAPRHRLDVFALSGTFAQRV